MTKIDMTRRLLFTAALVAAAGACSLDVTNPNAATKDEVLSTPAGLRAVAIGMQGRYGNALEEGIWIPGTVSGEIGTTNASQSLQREFQNFPDATANSDIEETNPELLDLWSKFYGVVRSANDVLDNVDAVPFEAGTRSGLKALARTMKADAFGRLIEAFEQIPLNVQQENPPFADRATVLAEILSLLAAADADLAATPASADFTNNVLAPGYNLPATITALRARYSLAAGNYTAALGFANAVPAGATSVIPYSSADPNPLRDAFHAARLFGALARFRTNAESGDTRVNKFTTSTALSAFGGASLVQIAVYSAFTDPIPVWTQEEMTLIRAEALARNNQLQPAIDQVNIVRQANGLLPKTIVQLPTQQAILDEIYTQRYYSLFLLGLHWADARRFGRTSEMKVPYLPYPLSERASNTNTPPNP